MFANILAVEDMNLNFSRLHFFPDETKCGRALCFTCVCRMKLAELIREHRKEYTLIYTQRKQNKNIAKSKVARIG